MEKKQMLAKGTGDPALSRRTHGTDGRGGTCVGLLPSRSVSPTLPTAPNGTDSSVGSGTNAAFT